MKFRVLLFLLSFLFVIQAQAASKPTVAEAEQFMNQAEARLNEIEVKAARASWVQENFITDDTQVCPPMPRINSQPRPRSLSNNPSVLTAFHSRPNWLANSCCYGCH